MSSSDGSTNTGGGNGGRSESRPFPLIRYFVITSFLAGLAVTIGTVWIATQALREDLLEEAKEHAVRVIRHLQTDIQSHFIEPTLSADGVIDIAANPEHFDRLDRVVKETTESFGILRIYIFDTDGNILYSTVREHVGFKTLESNDLYWDAVAGHVASAVRARGAPLHSPEQNAAQLPLLETYVPVRSLGRAAADATRVSNVIETYQDIDVFQHKVRKAQIQVGAYVVSGSAFLFLALFLIVARADRLIRRQTQDLVTSNRRLTDLSQHLEVEVEKRTQVLIAREKLASLGTLAAGLAHEVNNPLGTISVCAQGLSNRLQEHRKGAPLEVEEFDDYLRMIDGEAFRVKRITQNLLEFSRQRATSSIDEVDVLALFEETISLFQVSSEADDVEMVVDSDGRPVRFAVDPTDIRQLIFNIHRNALDAIVERIAGGVATERGRIEWRVARTETGLEFHCKDNGVGFEDRKAEELVEPFFTTKPPGKGTGLGLALCRSTVERHRGRFSIRSEGRGRGAEVSVFLPDLSLEPGAHPTIPHFLTDED